MTAIKTAGRVVVRVTATAGGDWQVVSSPTGFQGINASKFSDLDRIPGFVRFENGEDWEEYDGDDDENFLQILNTSPPVVIARPSVPFDSSNGGARVADASGEHTLVLEVGAASVKRFFRETNPTWKLLTGGDNTPSVADGRYFTTAGTTTITRFDDMEKGQFFVVRRGADDITIANGVDIECFDGADIELTADQPIAAFAENNAGIAVQISGAAGGANFASPAAQVTEANLADISHACNTTSKRLGTTKFETTNNRLYVALGSGAADPWRPFDDMTGISDVIPA